MDESKAREILKGVVMPDNSLGDCPEVLWRPEHGAVFLDGSFDVEELEAIAWWVQNMKVKVDK